MTNKTQFSGGRGASAVRGADAAGRALGRLAAALRR
jgi:hypothetical protein